MLTAKELHDKMMKEALEYKMPQWIRGRVDGEYFDEIHKQKAHKNNYSYEYLACVVRHVKPRAIVEIGADKGLSALALSLETDNKVYSVDIRDGWEYVPKDYDKIVKVIGDSLTVEIPTNLHNVDVWYIDGLHHSDQVRGEIGRFSPFWHKGTVVMMDDIHRYIEAWEEIDYDKIRTNGAPRGPWGLIVV